MSRNSRAAEKPGRRDTVDPGDVAPSDLVGSSVQRREDPRLITGEAEYTDDIRYPNALHLSLCRSSRAHARVDGIDTSRAEALDGVKAVYTQSDVEATGIDGHLRTSGADYAVDHKQPFLATDRITYQGQPVAAVLATDRYTAHEAAELIEIDLDPLEAVIDPEAALQPDAPQIRPEAPSNTAFEWEAGDPQATDAAFAAADETIPLRLEINRVLPTPMEPRAAIARYKPSTGHLTVEMSTQNPHSVQSDLSDALGLPDHRIRVRPPDVGGGFGAKLQPYTGHLLTAWAATELGRPVKWVSPRSEDCAAMVHSREHVVEAEAAVNDGADLIGLRLETVAPVGGYIAPGGAGVPTNVGKMANGQYEIPAVHVRTRGAFTTTAPLAAYRGAGRPEATYVTERVVSAVARELGVDPVEFRRQNFIPTDEFPYDTGLGRTFDSGEYEKALDAALDAIGYDSFRERQAAARNEDRYLGIGLSCYVEACGAGPDFHESGVVQIKPSGTVVVKTGTAEIGTGHQTSYAQIVADRLGVPYDDVEVIEGDTDHVIDGGGTAGSRAMAVAGSAVRESADTIIKKAREIAAHRLEASPGDVEFQEGTFHISGVPSRAVEITEVAEAAYNGAVPEGMESGLEATSYYDPPNYTFPFGTHVALVEVDPSTGQIEFERYVAIDDVGTQINPTIVEGQIHGGVAQGIGQALYEEARYDAAGQLETAGLHEYAVPRARQIPVIETGSTVTECPHNPLGVKGVGEAGAIGAPPAVVNAVIDALAPLGVESLDMPLTEESIWRAVREGDPPE